MNAEHNRDTDSVRTKKAMPKTLLVLVASGAL